MLKKFIFKKKILVFVFTLFLFLLVGNFTLATSADVDFGESYAESTNLGNSDPRDILGNLVNLAFTFLAIIAVIIIIYAGWLWMTSNGAPDKIEKAKKTLIGAVIGLIIMLSAWAIVGFILNSVSNSTGGGGCTDFDTRSCSSCIAGPGCWVDSAGSQTCMGGTWGACMGCGIDCGSLPGGTTYCDATPMDGVCGPMDPLDSDCALDEYCDDSCICQNKRPVGASCSLSGTCQNRVCLSEVCEGLAPTTCTCTSSPVIYSVTPTGGFCEDSVDIPCNRDSDCATGDCDRNTPNGAVGNLVTIGGYYFGSPGTVDFNGIVAQDPSSANPACSAFNSWTDNQIIVVVPAGISATNTIEVIRNDGLLDTTNNSVGPPIRDFLLNTIVRPGLCGINPNHGQINDTINYVGLNLLGSEAYMGHYSSYVPDYNSVFTSNLLGQGDVPSISVGTTTTFASSSGIYSNYLNFHKDAEPYTGPYITSFSPVLGPAGQYVTINGSGFGRFQNSSKVYFGATTSPNEANYDFPDVCADSFWSDRQIIVKVPSTTPSLRIIHIDIDSWGIISTDNGRVSPSTFNLTSGTPDPGVCKISPVMGPNGIPVSLWGEYFGSTLNLVRFFENYDQGSPATSFWGSEGDAERVNTIVHDDAISGPVNIVRLGGDISNDVNFEVGLCTEAGRTQAEQDDACGPDICCPAGTYKEGRCATSTNNCYIDIPSSVFEWEFNTGFGTTSIDDDSPYDSCQERSLDVGQCTSTQMCPNTTGKCSFNSIGITSETGECGDVYCNSIEICLSSPNQCLYATSTVLDNCLLNDGSNNYVDCDNNSTTTNILGDVVKTYCINGGHWHYNSNLSCSSGWSMAPGGGCTDFGSSCAFCDTGFTCVDDEDGDSQGYCGLSNRICGLGSDCIGDECIVTSPASCECCCRLGNSEQDCCSFENPPGSGVIKSLECMGNCGEDNAVDTDTYGYCSGCRIDLDGNTASMTLAEIDASDQACVCDNNYGQYCDYNADPDGDGDPDGVCRDCNTLPSAPLCSEHNSTCCVDAMDSDSCRGEVSEKIITAVLPDFSYCGYYHCDLGNTTCATSAPSVYDLASSTSIYPNLFDATSTCVQTCTIPSGGLGESCEARNESTVCDTGLCSNPFQCMVDSAVAPFALIYPSDCGYCCCDPNAAVDECVLAGLTETNCQADQSPCSGDYRGLCCGCSEDDDCVAIGNPTSVGCGSDTCCRPRPNVTSTLPVHTAVGVCSNAQISATFDSKMKIPSFTGNFILVGEYSGACPDGTTYLAQNKDNFKNRNFFVRLYYNIKSKIKYTFTSIARVFGYSAIAQTANYCAVPGMVTGENLANGNSRLTFSSIDILDTGTTYYAIVIGDRDLDSSRGVFSHWGIGMNASSTSPLPSNFSFNGVNYPNSYIWSFTTMDDQGTDGVCIIDHVNIIPDSYLFKTIDNNLEEDDTDPNDDSVSSNGIDRDKVFIAEARAAEEYDNQILTPFPLVYDWIWDWSIDNSLIVATSSPALFPATSSKKLIVAQEGAVNDYTVVRAEANLITDIYSYGYVDNQGSSTVYVFLCNNPWPPFSGAGTWVPWEDNNTNCVIAGSGCSDTNYEIYYCRDYGEEGITADDLPAIASDETLIIGSSTDKNKEFYFFREEIPDVTYITLNSATTLPAGGSITIDWSVNPAINASNTVAKYNIYYDTNSGVPYASVSSVDVPATSVTINNLTNGQEYCFSITAVYEDGGESDYSNEVCATPNDTSASAIPTINNIIPADREAMIAWHDNSFGNAHSFKIYYKASPVCNNTVTNFAGFIDVSYASQATTTITGLADGVDYCFGMVSVDEYGNESNPIIYATTTPFASPVNLHFTNVGTTTIDLAWDYTDSSGGGIDHNTIYYGTSSYKYIWNINTVNNQIQIIGLATGTPYFFNVVSYDVFSHNNGYINEESITILP